MTSPLASISGIISGIQYRDLVDQIIAAEGAPARRLRAQADRYDGQLGALAEFRNLLDTLRSAARKIRDGSAFDALATTTTAVSGAKAVVAASAGTAAAPGTYRVEVTALARAQKLGTKSFASATTPLGLSGSFTINDATVAVDANDTLVSLRDKLNAANTGAAASKVSASILSVGPGDHRLVLTSDATGAAGMTLVDGGGAPLQALELVDGAGVIRSEAVLVAGADAAFEIDGVGLTRSSNTVTDAIEGVTLTLTAEEPGAVTEVVVARHVDSARSAMKAFVEAYNAVVSFIRKQGTPPEEGDARPPLYNDSLLRVAATTLPRTLLTAVVGAASDLSTAAMAGLSLGQDGKLSLDTAKFDAAFGGRLQDLRTLFSQRGSVTDSRVTYLASSAATAPGTYEIVVTQAATQAAATGAGFSGTYADDGTPDTLTVTDLATGTQSDVTLAAGMTTAQIVSALNTAFAAATKRKLATANPLYGDPGGTVPMTGATTFAELRLAGGGAVTVHNGESISYGGVRPDGSTFGGTFRIDDPTTQTIGDLVGAIQAAYGTGATVRVENGTIVVEDTAARASSLALTLTAQNQNGGTLDFGATTVVAPGRGTMPLTASAVGNEIRITANDYGSTAGFTVAYAAGGADGTGQLGLPAGTTRGTDVAGTIGGNAATGRGRTLVGAAGTAVDGLTLSYAGTATGPLGSVTVTVGAGAQIERVLERWLAASTGTLDAKQAAIEARAAGLDRRADELEARLEVRRATLLKQFADMEVTLSRLQSQSRGVLAALGALTQQTTGK
ncbi:MAG TPA: flagellar filament capping protein FliD [Gemmatimonadales bacterium]|nr:flagellar filament capping protein FliD [Gemmatimonadales bacterium]